MIEIDDKSLVSELKSGGAAAFKVLVERHQDLVLNICYRYLHNRQDAEDTVQEVFIAAHRYIPRFREDAKLSTWLYRIAVSKSLDCLRMKNRKKRFSSIKNALGFSRRAEDITTPEGTNPDRAAERKERLQILDQALNTLPENQRIAITLSKYDGLSQQEIAEVLGTTVAAVESLVHRAKRNLKKKLTRYYEKNIE